MNDKETPKEPKQATRSDRKPVVRLGNYVRRHTSAIDVETLSQKGVKQINYLTVSRINDLIAAAVAKALEKYQRKLSQSDVRRVKSEALGELRRQIKSFQSASGAESAPKQKVQDQKIDVLERRVQKLNELLERAETALKDAEKKTVEPGVPSIYREVQGLKKDDRNYEQKATLLKVIFEDNVKLQWKTSTTAS